MQTCRALYAYVSESKFVYVSECTKEKGRRAIEWYVYIINKTRAVFYTKFDHDEDETYIHMRLCYITCE